MTPTVRSILDHKGYDLWSAPPDASVYDALSIMAQRNIGALPILEAGGLRGIFSERDYARKVVLRGRNSMDTPVREIMTPAVITVRPDDTVHHCMALMTELRTRHLPVVEGARVLGLISIGDVVHALIEEQSHVIEQLESYIRT